MLSNILSTATLVMAAWLSMQILHTHKALDSTQASFNGEIAKVRTELSQVSDQTQSMGEDMVARMDTMSAEQVKLAKSATVKVDQGAIKAKNNEIVRLKEVAALQTVYATVLQADLAGADEKGAVASELLLSTKKAVWKASEKFPDNKAALRGLMAPIDTLSGRWKRGDFKGDTKKIQVVLLEVLDAQSQSKSASK